MPSTGNIGVEADVATWSSGIAAGAGNHLPVGDYGGADYRSAMRFPIPAGWTAWTSITKATLTFYISDFQHVGPKSSAIFCSRMNMPAWTKGAGSQSCESGFSASNTTQYSDIVSTSTDRVSFTSGTTANKAITLDVTGAVQYYWRNNAKPVFVFDNNGSGQYTEIWADEKAGYDAVLNITYVAQSPPVAPTQNLPAAGAASATQTPTFTWTHSDPQGDPQASAQVRVWDAAGTTQVGATQTVTGTGASLVWPTALPRGVSYMWDVATADAANGYGPFSAKQAFSVKPNPTVTIDVTRYMSYVGGAPRLTVKWAVTNGTQYKYRVTAAGYDSGLLVSAATSQTLSTLGLTNGTAVPITVYVETSDPLNGSQTVSFTPRWGQTVHRRDLGAAPTGWGTPTVSQTVPSGAALIIEYGSSATATATPSPNTWYSTLSGVPKNRYVFYRATFIPSATAGPTLDKIVLPSSASVQVVDQWSTTKDGTGLAAPFSIDMGEYVYGSRSLTCDVPGAAGVGVWSQPIQVRAGRSYILTGLMKSQGNSGAQFRLVDSANADLVNPDGKHITCITPNGLGMLQADADWFTPSQRDVNRYATPVWVATSDMTVYIILRAGGAAGAKAWWDGIKLEESSVATPWSPAAVGATIIDAGGVQVDGSLGGVLRYRGTAGGLRDVVDGGANGLRFGGDTNVYSDTPGMLRIDGGLTVPIGTIMPSDMAWDPKQVITNGGFEFWRNGQPIGWSIPASWTSRSDGPNLYVRSGRTAIIAIVPTPSALSYGQSDQFPVMPGRIYRTSAWVQGYGPNIDNSLRVDALIRWYDGTGAALGSDVQMGPTSTTGNNQSGFRELGPALAVAPTGAVTAMYFIRLYNGNATDRVMIDDVTVEVVDRGPVILARNAPFTVAAATVVDPSYGLFVATATAAIVSTAAPLIAAGQDGQQLVILFSGTGSWAIKDDSVLAGTNVKLASAGTTYTMNDHDTLSLMYSSSAGKWVELSRSANV